MEPIKMGSEEYVRGRHDLVSCTMIPWCFWFLGIHEIVVPDSANASCWYFTEKHMHSCFMFVLNMVGLLLASHAVKQRLSIYSGKKISKQYKTISKHIKTICLSDFVRVKSAVEVFVIRKFQFPLGIANTQPQLDDHSSRPLTMVGSVVRNWWHLQGSPLDPSMASSTPESNGLLAGNPYNIRNPVGYLRISHHLRLFSLQYLFETPCLLGYVWSKTHPPGSSMISVEFVGSPGLQNKSQQRASAKNCHQTTYGQPDVFFEKSRNHARLIQLIFWLVDVGGMFKFGINKIHALFQQILYDKTGNLSWSPQWPACSVNLATGMASPVRKRFWVELNITQAIMMIISRLFAVIS